MKTFKKLATLSMALLLAFGLGALTACNGDDSSSSSAAPSSTNSESSVASSTTSDEDTSTTASTEDKSEETADSSSEENKTYHHYEFTVLDAAGNKVGEGYKVFLCTANMSNCFNPIEVSNGVCVYNDDQLTTPGEYVAHVMDANYAEVELKETVVTSADAYGAYTLQLAE